MGNEGFDDPAVEAAGGSDAPGATPPGATGEANAVERRLRDMRSWCRQRPLLCVAAGFVLLVAGGLAFLAATGQRGLALPILLALGGALTGAIGLLLLNEPVSAAVGAKPRLGRLAGAVALVAGLALVWFAISARSPILVVVGSVVVLLGLLAVNAVLLAGSGTTGMLFFALGTGLLVAGPVLIWIGDGVDGLSIIGAVAWTIGLVLFKVGLPPWIDVDPPTRRTPATLVSVAATAVGVGLLFLASRSFNEPALLFGLTLAVVGLSALGIGTARYEPGLTGAIVALGIGLVGMGVGALLTNAIVGSWVVTAVTTIVIAAIGAWFVFRGEALIAVLLLGFVVAWVVVDRTADAPVDPNPNGQLTILALGDSYISGEGAALFFEGTNVAGPGGNQCRRSPDAYPYRVAERLDARLIFLACSGAKTTDMDNQGPAPDPFPPIAGGEDQIERLVAVHGAELADIDAVLLSIGGNDVGFGTIIKACLLPQSCAIPELNDGWLANVAETRQQLVGTYLTLKSVVGDETPIVAVLYPTIVGPSEGCELAIGADEIEFVGRFTAALNDTVRAAAAEAGINLFDGTIDAFDGRLLCDDAPATNFFHLAPTEGPFADAILPANWVHGTLHPRGDGHELIADRLVATGGAGTVGYLEELLASVEAGGPANPPPGDGPGAGSPEYQDLPDDEWIEEQLYRTVGSLVLPVGLLLIGGLLAAFAVVKARFPVLDFLDPSNNRTGQV